MPSRLLFLFVATASSEAASSNDGNAYAADDTLLVQSTWTHSATKMLRVDAQFNHTAEMASSAEHASAVNLNVSNGKNNNELPNWLRRLAPAGHLAEREKWRPTRQQIKNHNDVQYVAQITIGKEPLWGVLDTGSFEMVVFPTTCTSCGIAAKYDPKASNTHVMGALTSSDSFGSGDLYSTQAFDYVKVADFPPVNQSFWSVDMAAMSILVRAKFNLILGVGPPETPAADAWKYAMSDIEALRKHLEEGVHIPKHLPLAVTKSIEAAKKVTGYQTLLDNLHVEQFSLCFGRDPGADGYIIWDDDSFSRKSFQFTRVPIVGRHTWSVSVKNAAVEIRGGPSIAAGCENGCSALLDTGSSLMALPPKVFAALENATKDLRPDCSNVWDLPDLTIDMNGMRIILPPTSYVAELSGRLPAMLKGFFKYRNDEPSKPRCHLFAMQVRSQTTYGSNFIFGIPFFREYYTTFKLGQNRESRALYVAPAVENCQPHEAATRARPPRVFRKIRTPLHRVDISMLHLPHRMYSLVEDDYVRL